MLRGPSTGQLGQVVRFYLTYVVNAPLGTTAPRRLRYRRALALALLWEVAHAFSYPNVNMNNGIVFLPGGVPEYHSLLLFGLTTPIGLPTEEFDKVWPFVSSVYL